MGTAATVRLGVLRFGEVAEWSKALDWNSSNALTGIRGFESHPLRHTADGRGLSR
jgi:hypothetical protein